MSVVVRRSSDGSAGLVAAPDQDELRRAAEGGLLVEGHDRDVKRELPPPGPSGNAAIATDMAAMAIDGGPQEGRLRAPDACRSCQTPSVRL